MSELQDSSEVQQYSSGVLYILSSIAAPPEFIEPLTEAFIDAVESSSVSGVSSSNSLNCSYCYFCFLVMADSAQSHSRSRCLVLPKPFKPASYISQTHP